MNVKSMVWYWVEIRILKVTMKLIKVSIQSHQTSDILCQFFLNIQLGCILQYLKHN